MGLGPARVTLRATQVHGEVVVGEALRARQAVQTDVRRSRGAAQTPQIISGPEAHLRSREVNDGRPLLLVLSDSCPSLCAAQGLTCSCRLCRSPRP